MQTTAETNGFKETEIGLIPEDWKLVTLGQVSELIMGQSPPSSVYNTVGNGLPFFQGKAEFGELYPAPSKWCSKPIKIAEQKDVLVSVRAPVGDVNIAPFECCIGRGLAAIRTKTDLDSLYLFYYLVTAKKKLESEGRGTTFKAVGRSVLENFKLPLPLKEEQQKIALVLSKIQQAIEQQDKIIETTRNLKKSLMQKLFTEGIGHTEFKDSDIGQIPENWENIVLGQLVEIRKETVLPNQENETVYIGLEHIEPANVKISKKGSSKEVKSSKFKFYQDDILFGKLRPYLDKAALAEFEGICSTDIMVMKTKPITVPTFIVNRIHLRDFLNYVTSTMTGVNHPRTSWLALSKFELSFPPLSEQKEIAHILSLINNKIDAEQKRQSVLQQLFKTMLSKLMTGEIRVKNLNLGVYNVN